MNTTTDQLRHTAMNFIVKRVVTVFGAAALVAISGPTAYAADECIVKAHQPVGSGMTELQVVKVVRGNEAAGDPGKIYFDTRFISWPKLQAAGRANSAFRALIANNGVYGSSPEDAYKTAITECVNQSKFPDAVKDVEQKKRICAHRFATGEYQFSGLSQGVQRDRIDNPAMNFKLQSGGPATSWFQGSLPPNVKAGLGAISVRVPNSKVGETRGKLVNAFRATGVDLGCKIMAKSEQDRLMADYNKQREDPLCK